jgi:FkbH-like protein
MSNFSFDKIKLIIWDLDDTFWSGTLSEGSVVCPAANIALIHALSDAGIVNSISSKNDSDKSLAELEKIDPGLSSYFVFNNINWDEKGSQIKDKLSKMGLRAENTLFIDDNERNLEEATFHNPGLMTSTPDIIQELINYLPNSSVFNKDLSHSRLDQYKMLETKAIASENYSSNEQFLYDSNILVDICFDCIGQIDRIAEMVARTNQLNFTKNRVDKAELEKQLLNDWNRCAYITVRDKFGDYGIVGFFCYNRMEKKMEHFLFSCRILGMGVEQYIYSRMGYPDFEIAEPVASKLSKEGSSPWISEDTGKTASSQVSGGGASNRLRILLKGPCDLSAIEQYLIGGSLTTEFNFVNNKGFITTGQNHSIHIFEGKEIYKDDLASIMADAPFIIPEDFQTLLFDNKYHIICYSLLADCHAGVYRHKDSGLMISFGSVNFDLTDEKNWEGYINGTVPNHFYPFTEELLRDFKSKWEFIGTTPYEVLLYNLEYMYENAPGSPTFILLLGSEIDYDGESAEFADHAKRHAEVNRLIEDFAKDKPRIRLINFTDYIHSQEDFEDSINHFSRRVYYDVATKTVEYINEKVQSLISGANQN